MDRIRDIWNSYIEEYHGRIVKLLLGAALLLSILFNLGIVSPNQNWLLSIILFAVLTFSAQLDSIYKKLIHSKLRVYEMHSPKYDEDINHALSTSEVKEVQFIEFSTYAIQAILMNELIEKKYAVQLLMAHPQSAPNLFQRQRIEGYLRDLLLKQGQRNLSGDTFQVRCYKPTAAFCGRKIGNVLISVSWYTYGTLRIKTFLKSEHERQLREPQDLEGHTNVRINADLSSKEGRVLERMFDRVFKDLWSDAIPLEDVVKTLEIA